MVRLAKVRDMVQFKSVVFLLLKIFSKRTLPLNLAWPLSFNVPEFISFTRLFGPSGNLLDLTSMLTWIVLVPLASATDLLTLFSPIFFPSYSTLAVVFSNLKLPKFVFLTVIWAIKVALNEGDGEVVYLRALTVTDLSFTCGDLGRSTTSEKTITKMLVMTIPAKT